MKKTRLARALVISIALSLTFSMPVLADPDPGISNSGTTGDEEWHDVVGPDGQVITTLSSIHEDGTVDMFTDNSPRDTTIDGEELYHTPKVVLPTHNCQEAVDYYVKQTRVRNGEQEYAWELRHYDVENNGSPFSAHNGERELTAFGAYLCANKDTYDNIPDKKQAEYIDSVFYWEIPPSIPEIIEKKDQNAVRTVSQATQLPAASYDLYVQLGGSLTGANAFKKCFYAYPFLCTDTIQMAESTAIKKCKCGAFYSIESDGADTTAISVNGALMYQCYGTLHDPALSTSVIQKKATPHTDANKDLICDVCGEPLQKITCPAPTLKQATTNSIEIYSMASTIDGAQVLYSLNNEEWTTNTKWTGLSSNSSYTIKAKVVAPQYSIYVDSDESKALTAKTSKTTSQKTTLNPSTTTKTTKGSSLWPSSSTGRTSYSTGRSSGSSTKTAQSAAVKNSALQNKTKKSSSSSNSSAITKAGTPSETAAQQYAMPQVYIDDPEYYGPPVEDQYIDGNISSSAVYQDAKDAPLAHTEKTSLSPTETAVILTISGIIIVAMGGIAISFFIKKRK